MMAVLFILECVACVLSGIILIVIACMLVRWAWMYKTRSRENYLEYCFFSPRTRPKSLCKLMFGASLACTAILMIPVFTESLPGRTAFVPHGKTGFNEVWNLLIPFEDTTFMSQKKYDDLSKSNLLITCHGGSNTYTLRVPARYLGGNRKIHDVTFVFELELPERFSNRLRLVDAVFGGDIRYIAYYPTGNVLENNWAQVDKYLRFWGNEFTEDNAGELVSLYNGEDPRQQLKLREIVEAEVVHRFTSAGFNLKSVAFYTGG